MQPKLWGKYAWPFLHMVTMAYPENPTEEDKKNYRRFFHDLTHVLPCSTCGNNLKGHLKKYPLTDEVLASRKNLTDWLIDIHNVVNHYTGKPVLTNQEAMTELNKLANPKTSRNNIWLYLLIFVIVVLLCFIIFRYLKKLN